jgi:hypothetical protein
VEDMVPRLVRVRRGAHHRPHPFVQHFVDFRFIIHGKSSVTAHVPFKNTIKASLSFLLYSETEGYARRPGYDTIN